jgi:hypothetical protein
MHGSETFFVLPPSFPSDHAVAAFAIAFVVAVIGRRMGALFLAGASVLALARVVAGIHYPGDVLGGAVIGLVSALLVLRLGSGYFPAPSFAYSAASAIRSSRPAGAPSTAPRLDAGTSRRVGQGRGEDQPRQSALPASMADPLARRKAHL